jgi:hypothetical protein
MDTEEYRRDLEARIRTRITEGGGSSRLARFAAGPLGSGADAMRAGGEDPVMEDLAVAGDAGRPAAERQAALAELRAASFVATRFAPYEEDYRELLRVLIDDPIADIAGLALETLAHERDPYAMRRLEDGLRREAPIPLSDAKAVQLLGQDDHGEAAPLIRDLLARTSDPAIWDEGLRALATDPASHDLIVATMRDRGTPVELRQTGARALQALNPESFEQEAMRVVADPSEADDLRATCLAILAQGRPFRTARADPEVRGQAEELAESGSDQMKSAASSFLQAPVDERD